MNAAVQPWSEILIVVIVLSSLLLLGSHRLVTNIRTVAAQGLLISILPLLLHSERLTLAVLATVGITLAIRAVVFPILLFRAMNKAHVPREQDSDVSYPMAVALGVGLVLFSVWLSPRLPAPGASVSPLLLPAGIFTVLAGLLLIVVRRRALSQVIGYIVLENGIYTLGTGLGLEEELIIQLGVLLDVFVGVFVMGIAIYHISEEFETADVDELSQLKH